MKIPCNICPRRCNAIRPLSPGEPGQYGFCRAPEKAVVSYAGLHLWEEPVISGSRGSGTVFFSGCNLHCVYCQNHCISNESSGVTLNPDQLHTLYHRLINLGAHNINLVTAGHFAHTVADSLSEKLPVPVVYNSNGYELPETLKLFENKVDIYLPDLKYANPETAAKYSHAPDYFDISVNAIREMIRQTGKFVINNDGIMQKGVIIRHLILPGQLENTLDVIKFVAENFQPGEVIFSLMQQYLPCGIVSNEKYPELNRRISKYEYDVAEAALFASGIEDGFVQDADSAVKDFIPNFQTPSPLLLFT